MLGELNTEQIDHVLHSQTIGRIGCCTNGEVYVVPVTYVFSDNSIYAHSREGKKIIMMRENNKVCFQVDQVDNMANWRSVIIWGTYEELQGDAQNAATAILNNKLMPMVTSETSKPHRQTMIPHFVEKEKKPIIYRIKIERKTGRFEKKDG